MNTKLLQRGASSGIVVALIVIILLVVGIVFFTGDEVADEEMMNEEVTEETEEEGDVQGATLLATSMLDPVDDTELAGQVAFTDVNEETVVSVEISGTEEDSSHPIHIHAGTCEELGDVVYPLSNVEGGLSLTYVDDFMLEGDHVVNVHASEEDHATIACGAVEMVMHEAVEEAEMTEEAVEDDKEMTEEGEVEVTEEE